MTLFALIAGCNNPTEKFDGTYAPDIDETKNIHMDLSVKYSEESLQNFSVRRGVIRCGRKPIREWVLYESQMDGEKLTANAVMYLDREIIIERAIMHEDVDDIANHNKFEAEVSLEFTRNRLIFCNWLNGVKNLKCKSQRPPGQSALSGQ